jgi:transposase-like protein
MSDWIEAELAECQMHDARHTKRLGRLLDRSSARPVNSIRLRVMAGQRPWLHIAFWTTRTSASRRFFRAIPMPLYSGSAHKRSCCWYKIPRFWITARPTRRLGWAL